MKKMFSFVIALIVIASLTIVPAMAEDTNLALGKTAVCEAPEATNVASLEGNVFFSYTYLTDGEVPVWDGVSAVPICWYGAAVTQDAVITITIDLESIYALKQVALAPAGFLEGQNMPSDYEVLVSKDNSQWTKVGEESGITGAQSQKFVYNTTEEARYVKISITKVSSVQDANYYYVGLGEIEVLGGPVTEPSSQNPATSDSTFTSFIMVITVSVLAFGAYVSMRRRNKANV